METAGRIVRDVLYLNRGGAQNTETDRDLETLQAALADLMLSLDEGNVCLPLQDQPYVSDLKRLAGSQSFPAIILGNNTFRTFLNDEKNRETGKR